MSPTQPQPGKPAEIDAVTHIVKRYPGLKLAIVFGSVATGTAHHDSDLDLAVWFDTPVQTNLRKDLIETLAVELGRPVDLIDLATAGQPLLGEILSKGKRIAGSDAAYGALISKNLFDRTDFLPYRRRILDQRRKAWLKT